MAKLTSRNQLYYGDNLEVMRRFVKDESVDLCYMDPPFNSKRAYNQIYNNVGDDDPALSQAFLDTWKWDDHARAAHREILANEQGRFPAQLVDLIRGLYEVLGRGGNLFAYLVGMSLRLTEVRRILKTTGSFYLHCDPTASHYLKLVCDAVFCSGGGEFQNEMIWKRTTSHSDSSTYGNVHDVILFYTKSDEWSWSQQYVEYDPEYVEQYYRYKDPDGRRFMSGDMAAQGGAETPRRFGNKVMAPPKGNHWRYSQENIDKLLAENRIFFTKNGYPRVKRYLDEAKGMPVQDIWDDIEPIRSWHKEKIGFPTQKPLGILERIIKTSCPEDGVVFDPCCGCGTTIAATERLNIGGGRRKWIGIDITYQSISVILRRLEDQSGTTWPDVERNISLNGIPRDMESAKALAHKRDDRVRKEFEKWAVLTYTKNRGVINEKKGADAGIDGRVYFMTSATDNAKMILQVKSGIVDRGDIATLRGDMEREGAALATLITLVPPTKPMQDEAKKAGLYHHEMMDRDYDRIQIVTVQEIIEEKRRLDIPAIKEGKKQSTKPAADRNLSLFENVGEPVPKAPTNLLGHMKQESGERAAVPHLPIMGMRSYLDEPLFLNGGRWWNDKVPWVQNLTVRASNVLSRAGKGNGTITTRELLSYPPSAIRNMSGCGDVSYRDIVRALRRYRIRWGE